MNRVENIEAKGEAAYHECFFQKTSACVCVWERDHKSFLLQFMMQQQGCPFQISVRNVSHTSRNALLKNNEFSFNPFPDESILQQKTLK